MIEKMKSLKDKHTLQKEVEKKKLLEKELEKTDDKIDELQGSEKEKINSNQ